MPHCGSEQVIKADKTKRKYVTRQGYRCKECKRFFMERDGFEERTHPGKIISLVLDLFVEGLSLSKIREIVYQHHGYKPADSTILDWVKSYSKILKRFERKHVPRPRVKERGLARTCSSKPRL